MKELLCNNAMFGIVLCAVAWEIGQLCQKKLKSPLLNPLLIGIVVGAAVLLIFDIPLDWFRRGANMVDAMLLPSTAALGLSIYRQRKILGRNFVPIVAGCTAGCVMNAVTVLGLCRLIAMDSALTSSLLPRSVTTPIAIALSEQGGGLPAITVASVLFTGILGAVFAPVLIRFFKLEDCPVAAGVAIGSASHVLGTTTAMKMGPVQGAMSSVAIGVSGLLTVVLAIFW